MIKILRNSRFNLSPDLCGVDRWLLVLPSLRRVRNLQILSQIWYPFKHRIELHPWWWWFILLLFMLRVYVVSTMHLIYTFFSLHGPLDHLILSTVPPSTNRCVCFAYLMHLIFIRRVIYCPVDHHCCLVLWCGCHPLCCILHYQQSTLWKDSNCRGWLRALNDLIRRFPTDALVALRRVDVVRVCIITDSFP